MLPAPLLRQLKHPTCHDPSQYSQAHQLLIFHLPWQASSGCERFLHTIDNAHGKFVTHAEAKEGNRSHQSAKHSSDEPTARPHLRAKWHLSSFASAGKPKDDRMRQSIFARVRCADAKARQGAASAFELSGCEARKGYRSQPKTQTRTQQNALCDLHAPREATDNDFKQATVLDRQLS